MSMHAYARHLLQEVAVAVAVVPMPSSAGAPNQIGDNYSSSPVSLPAGDSPPHLGFRFSPTTVIVLVTLVSAFLFMGCFAIYIRRCSREDNYLSRYGNGASGRTDIIAGQLQQRGVDPSLVKAIPMVSYAAAKRKGCNECVVCLADFEKGEELKQLPKCKHVFHPECIDVWLESHTTCPVCRRSLVNSDRWAVSWRWGGSLSRGASLSRLNEGESLQYSRRGTGSSDQFAAAGCLNGDAITGPQVEECESGHRRGTPALAGSPLSNTEMVVASNTPAALSASCLPVSEIVAEELPAAGCILSCGQSEMVVQRASVRACKK